MSAERVLTVENTTDTPLGFVLCRKATDGCLHLHIVDPEDNDDVHGERVLTFEPPDMRTFSEASITDVHPGGDADE